MAMLDTGESGVGNTWPEAVGALVAAVPERFGVGVIEYATDAATRVHVVERGLDRRIV